MTESKKNFALRSIILMILVVFVFPFLPMIVSGQWRWWEAWVYALLSIVGFVASRALAARRNADILMERSRSIELQGAKSWDKILAPMLAFGSLLILVVAGLDKSNGWSLPFSLNAKIISLVVIVLGFVFGSWALIENRFFSGVVRIQTDRGHHVVTTGPYRIVRHPGYAGALWTYLAMPVLLDSLWAFIPALLLIGVLVLRTSLEDRTLQAELPGYADFAKKTRYRLFPGIW
jgi:protein-S-isoprenylcysteine O-methyltransferase Ste14